MSAAYAGQRKTDANDAYGIAEAAWLRRDLAVIDADTDWCATSPFWPDFERTSLSTGSGWSTGCRTN